MPLNCTPSTLLFSFAGAPQKIVYGKILLCLASSKQQLEIVLLFIQIVVFSFLSCEDIDALSMSER